MRPRGFVPHDGMTTNPIEQAALILYSYGTQGFTVAMELARDGLLKTQADMDVIEAAEAWAGWMQSLWERDPTSFDEEERALLDALARLRAAREETT